MTPTAHHTPGTPPAAKFARFGVAIMLVSVVAGLAVGLAPGVSVPCDFIAFWSSAVLFTTGQNPYDPALLLPIQFEAGWQLGYAITIFNPPWVLALLAPLAALPVQLACGVWFGTQFALTLFAARWLWLAVGGAENRMGVPVALTIAFVPVFVLLTGGQLTGVTLFGAAGFLYFRERNRPGLAGCLGALTAIKPHLFMLFALVLIIDAIRSRSGRMTLLAGAIALLVACVGVWVARPTVFAEYHAVLTSPGSDSHRGMTDYAAPVAGVMLRDAVAGRPVALQFAPFAIAAVALLGLMRRFPPERKWGDYFPFLLLASLVVAPYGGWWYDMVLVLPAVLLAAARVDQCANPQIQRIAVGCFVLLDLAIFVLYSRREQLTPLFALVPLLAAFGAIVLLRAARAEGSIAPLVPQAETLP
jgi:hypothetical protein